LAGVVWYGVVRLGIGADVARALNYLHGRTDDGTPHGSHAT
jgi:hypothetical protein